jgi:hypothetical protein
MLKPILLNELAQHIDQRVVSGDFTINGVTYPAKIRRSISNGTMVRKHIYLTQKDPYGTVTRARLIGGDGQVLAERTDPQVHEQGKGLLLEFKFTVQEV